MSLPSLLRADELEESRQGVEPFLRREPERGGLVWEVVVVVHVCLWFDESGSTIATVAVGGSCVYVKTKQYCKEVHDYNMTRNDAVQD